MDTMYEDTMAKEARKAEGIRQIWMKAPDVENFERVARMLEAQDVDVLHDGKYSLTKVVRHLLKQAAKKAPRK